MIEYCLEPNLSTDDFLSILRLSGLDARRPIHNLDQIEGMLKNADIIVTARQEGHIIGVSRALTDYHFCTYLSDLAVSRDHQRKGIGKLLIEKTHEAAGKQTRLILISAPAARDYYPHIGLEKHDSCWMIPPVAPK